MRAVAAAAVSKKRLWKCRLTDSEAALKNKIFLLMHAAESHLHARVVHCSQCSDALRAIKSVLSLTGLNRLNIFFFK